MEHWHQTSYADCLAFIAKNPPEENVRYEIVLVRDDDDRRSWAYMEDGKLPEYALDAYETEWGKIPKKYHAEVARAHK